MKPYLLVGRPAKWKLFIALVILFVLSWFLAQYLVTLYGADTSLVNFYQRRVASLERQVLVLEKKVAHNNHNLHEQVAVIADLMKEDLSDSVREQMKEVQKALLSLTAPQFKHRPETSHLDCRRLFLGDEQYMAEIARARIVLVENSVLDMECDALHWRVFPRLRQPTLGYGIAFARIVHTDYEFLEEQLQVNYSPENHYCYHVDSKSPILFKERMAKLASCLPNVYLTDDILEINGKVGTNVNFAHMACLKVLEDKGSWQYVVLQQKSAHVLRLLYDQNMKWDAESLGVFQDLTLRPSSEALKTPLVVVKGGVQVSLSREAVTWLNRINLTKLISQFNSGASYLWTNKTYS
ncbi:Core-2/I-Branching enzyme [Cooperia oncophora]